MYPRSAEHRHNLLAEARATNYGVVRLELIEHLYERMYDQRRELGVDEKTWPHRILGGRQITTVEPLDDSSLELTVETLPDVRRATTTDSSNAVGGDDAIEKLEVDLVIAATGYQRTAHVDMLRDSWDLLPKAAPMPSSKKALRRGIAGWDVETDQGERKLAVGRNYQVQFKPESVAAGSGVWLQGCCEGTHGVSSSLSPFVSTGTDMAPSSSLIRFSPSLRPGPVRWLTPSLGATTSERARAFHSVCLVKFQSVLLPRYPLCNVS